MNPHRTHALSYRHVPVTGFKQHARYINDGPIPKQNQMLTAQSESDVLATVRNEYGCDHYNPRLLPTVQRAVEFDYDGIYCLIHLDVPDEHGIAWDYEVVYLK